MYCGVTAAATGERVEETVATAEQSSTQVGASSYTRHWGADRHVIDDNVLPMSPQLWPANQLDLGTCLTGEVRISH